MAPAPSRQAFVPFVSVDRMMRLVHHIGVEQVMIDLAAEIGIRCWGNRRPDHSPARRRY